MQLSSQQTPIRRAALLSICLFGAFVVDGTVWGQDPDSQVAGAAGLNFFDLLLMGKYWMLPILLMSMLVVTCTIERLIGLRRSRILPRRLVSKLERMRGPAMPFDPREAHTICESHPSAAATVVKAMLAKIGRPHSEVEQAVQEACQREAARMHSKVRWLNLAAAVTPLMGLLGTVWGMIRAFHDTTQLIPGQNKADHLAEGIYVALVTTLGGLLVAIPAAIFAHYFEGRIQNSLLKIEELLLDMMPRVEKYEGRRLRNPVRESLDGFALPHVEPPPVQSETSTTIS
jgi:biopolymer transport protein ExbB